MKKKKQFFSMLEDSFHQNFLSLQEAEVLCCETLASKFRDFSLLMRWKKTAQLNATFRQTSG